LESDSNGNNLQQLFVEPDNLYFGSLKPGEGCRAVLKITGGPAEVINHNDRLQITPSNIGVEDIICHVELLAGSAGELLWDTISVKSQSCEISVIITARWEGFPVQTGGTVLIDERIPSGEQKIIKPTLRPWIGRQCSYCHKNFAYNSDNHEWEQCKCNSYQKLLKISAWIFEELRYGIKEVPTFVKETYNVILGKENW
jgi:hypothetical protein